MAHKKFFCIDAHTCGNPVRLVAGGGPLLEGNSMMEKRLHFLREYDWIRKGLMFEPRGHDMMSGSILYPPCDPQNDIGVLYIETSGCLPMCGHGTIGTITIAIEEGLVQPKVPGKLRIETPAGLVLIEYKQEGKKPFTYDDQRTGIPVVQMDPLKEGKAYSSFQRFINESDEDEIEDYLETPEKSEDDEIEDEEYQYLDLGNEDDDELRASATASNATMSDLRQIEDKLRNFEHGGNFDEEEEDFGANPMDTPFGEIPDWVIKLNQAPEDPVGEEY
jgi:hypothetical protein